MGTLLSLIFFASIFGIWYFWKRKPNKKYLISSIVALVLSTFLFSFTPEYKQTKLEREQERTAESSKKEKSISESKKLASEKKASQAKETSKKKETSITKATKASSDSTSQKKKETTKSSAEASSSSDSKTLLRRAKKLKRGMSYDEVKRIMKDKPTTDERSESGTYLLQYNFSTVILSFDENDKLTAAIEGAPQIAKQAQESIKKAKKESSDNRDKLIGFAQSFGRKPVEKLQKMSMVYTSERIGDRMYYVWDTGEESVGKLVRVDDPEKFTTVYQYDENGEDGMLGKQLYSGRTIMDNPTKVYIYQ